MKIMNVIFITFVLTSLLTTVHSDCSLFEKQWKNCPPEMLPNIPMDRVSCTYKINSSTKVIIANDMKKISAVNCDNDTFPDSIFDCLPFKNSVHLMLTDCPFPQTSFDKFFSKSNLNELTVLYQNSHIFQKSIKIHNLPSLQFLSLKNINTFSYFDLILNSISQMKSIKISGFTFTSLPVKPFKDLSNLKGLALTKGVLETLPDDFLSGTNLEKLDLSINKLKHFQPNLMKNMNKLKTLNVSHNLLETIDENLFTYAANLETVSLEHNRINALPPMLFRAASNIRKLYINHNNLKEIPDSIFQGLKQMLLLSLNHNYLSDLPPNVFKDTSFLIALDLQSNKLRSLSNTLFASQKYLHQINLSNNKISRFSSSAPFGNSKYLTKVNISNNQLEEFLDLNWSLYNITQLDLSGNSIHNITIPISNKPGGSIFLQRNQISKVTVTKNMSYSYLYFLNGNPFDCSCNLSDFVSILSTVADAEKLVCQEPCYQIGKRIKDFENKTKELCKLNNDCPLKCKCHQLLNNQIEVDCSNMGLTCAAISLPFQTAVLHLENNKISSLSNLDNDSWKNLTHLYLSNNSLTTLRSWSIPPKLQLLAIDGNELTNLPSSVKERVSESEDFWIYLKDNNWQCDCQSIPLKMWLKENLHKVKDSQLTYCKSYNDDKPISSVDQTPLIEIVCVEPQHSSQKSNNCAKSEMHISVSVVSFLMVYIVNKLYC